MRVTLRLSGGGRREDPRRILPIPVGPVRAAHRRRKTITFCYVAEHAVEKGNRVAILVHRQELVAQTADSLEALGVEFGLIAPANLNTQTGPYRSRAFSRSSVASTAGRMPSTCW